MRWVKTTGARDKGQWKHSNRAVARGGSKKRCKRGVRRCGSETTEARKSGRKYCKQGRERSKERSVRGKRLNCAQTTGARKRGRKHKESTSEEREFSKGSLTVELFAETTERKETVQGKDR